MWNQSDVNSRIVLGESEILIDICETTLAYRGWTNVNTVNSAIIYIYKNNINYEVLNEPKSVIVHEIGHLFGLIDNPLNILPEDTLMSHYRNRSSIYCPQIYDVHNVNFIYS